MSRGALIGAGLLCLGLTAGGLLGNQGFDRAHDPRLLCPTCHDDMDLAAADTSEMPHSATFHGTWHARYGLQPQAYLELLFGSFGQQAPLALASRDDQQQRDEACLACHLEGVETDIPCGLCHAENQEDWDHTELIVSPHRCMVCHRDQSPLGPHHPEACRDCHLEVVGNTRKKAKMVVMEQRRREREEEDPALREGLVDELHAPGAPEPAQVSDDPPPAQPVPAVDDLGGAP